MERHRTGAAAVERRGISVGVATLIRSCSPIGLRFHTDEAQVTEVAIAAEVLNRMLDLGRPNSGRVI